MTSFVLDASVALAWCFADEATPATMALLDRLVDEGARRAFRDALNLVRSERLTVHDAAYLELALRRGLPLASKDAKLRHAAAGLGLGLLGT